MRTSNDGLRTQVLGERLVYDNPRVRAALVGIHRPVVSGSSTTSYDLLALC